jgi:hypothetical protein
MKIEEKTAYEYDPTAYVVDPFYREYHRLYYNVNKLTRYRWHIRMASYVVRDRFPSRRLTKIRLGLKHNLCALFYLLFSRNP